MRFADRVAMIVGAASGMGRLTAERLATEGARLLLCDQNGDALAEVAQALADGGADVISRTVDVRNFGEVSAAVDAAVERWGTVDLSICFAGGSASRVWGRSEGFHELPIEVLDWGLDVNLKGALYVARAVMGPMIAAGRGVIVSLGSVDGLTGSFAVEYSAAKSGILGLTKSLALYGAPHGVRACCVSPGPVMTRPAMANMKTRLGRAAEPWEVVNLILYLCSDDAAFITGSNHTIDGGRSCGGP